MMPCFQAEHSERPHASDAVVSSSGRNLRATDSQLLQNSATAYVPTLSWARILAYGVGHAYNDMCATMWFSYVMVFYNLVRDMDSSWAGALLLIGQVAD